MEISISILFTVYNALVVMIGGFGCTVARSYEGA